MTEFVVVVGGAGALGDALIAHFRHKYVTVNVDYRSNAAAHFNVDATNFSWETLEGAMAVGSRVVLVANTAGGWTGGTIEDPQLGTKCTQMWRMNVDSSVLAGQIAARYFAAAGPGLCVFVGAKGVAMHETPDMLAYAMAKQAVASLASNLACTPRSGLPEGTSVVLLLPEVLDTEANRQAMPNADRSKWTPPMSVAAHIGDWLGGNGKDSAEGPLNGSQWLITTRDSQTTFSRK